MALFQTSVLKKHLYQQDKYLVKKINKGKSKNSGSMTQLRDHDRYIYYANHNNGMWIGLGYWMNNNNEKNYLDVAIAIEPDPKSIQKEELTNTFIEIGEKEDDWFSSNTINSSGWCGIKYQSSLQNFLSEENQITKIKEFFNEGLIQTDRILKEYSNLPRRKRYI